MTLKKTAVSKLGYNFISPDFIPSAENEYYLRNKQAEFDKPYRQLSEPEIQQLIKNRNTSDNWKNVYVTTPLNPDLIRNCSFYGMVRIGQLDELLLEFHDLKLPVGLYNSTIISSDLGDNVVINNVHYLSHYIVGAQAILFNIDELQTSDHAKFGNGIVKQGEDESIRIWMEIGNENGGRKIAPFNGMLTSDAWLWSKYRDDKELMQYFTAFTDNDFSKARGYYGTIGQCCVIKNCQMIKDVKIGDAAYIKGANKLKNLTINSSFDSPTQIGEGTELVNGIIGFGCKLFYGVKAVRFVLGDNSALKYGARLINAMLGENSTISCCEVLNALLLPAHEQHHNNSFLIAATLFGQSNVAAGATIGSNHNSRANDGEIIAGRGFWPGLCVSLKHNSIFTSFNLIAKGNYPHEINNPLPFALITNNEQQNRLEIMPAYWWMYNMYALERNTWKYRNRDKRMVRRQEFEFEYLAPDSVNEIINAINRIEYWTGKAQLEKQQKQVAVPYEELVVNGKALLITNPDEARQLEIKGESIEASVRSVKIIKPVEAYHAYHEMIVYYGTKTLAYYLYENKINYDPSIFDGAAISEWVNIGGQLITTDQLLLLKTKIKTGKINSWAEVHQEYSSFHANYPLEKAKHAYACLIKINNLSKTGITGRMWERFLNDSVTIAKKVNEAIYNSRQKDYLNPFRRMVYSNQEEMEEVLGKMAANEFIISSHAAYEKYIYIVKNLLGQMAN